VFAAGAALGNPLTEAQRDELAKRRTELVVRCKADKDALRRRLTDGAGGAAAADSLATLLLRVLAPNPVELVQVHEQAAAALRGAAR
jgi:hypothetical protein